MTEVHERCDDADRQGWTPAVRLDVGRLARAERTSAGGVRVRGAVSCAGVLTYQRADGTVIRELLPPEELGRPESLETLRDAPITVGHPPPGADGSQLVTPETYRRLSIGHVSGEPGVEDEHLLTELVVQDAEAMARCDSGDLAELSPGYVCMIEPTPGTWKGERYDQVQRLRKYNHVALLPKGGARGGQTVSLRVDGHEAIDCAVQVDGDRQPPTQPTERIDSMEHERIDGVTYKVGSPEWREALSRKVARLDEEVAKLSEEKGDAEEEKVKADADLEAMTAERDALKAKVAELDAKIAELEDPEAMDARADARAALLTSARRVLGAEAKFERADGKPMSDLEIKRAVVAKVAPDAADKPEAYIDARFDAAIEHLAPASPLTEARRTAFQGASPRADSNASGHTRGRRPPPSLGDAYRRR